jgi:hypothetical protein
VFFANELSIDLNLSRNLLEVTKRKSLQLVQISKAAQVQRKPQVLLLYLHGNTRDSTTIVMEALMIGIRQTKITLENLLQNPNPLTAV